MMRNVAFTFVGTLSVGTALILSLKFIKHSSAEPAPISSAEPAPMNVGAIPPPATAPASAPTGTPPPPSPPSPNPVPNPVPNPATTSTPGATGTPPAGAPPAGAPLPNPATPRAPSAPSASSAPSAPPLVGAAGAPDPNSQNAGITQLEGFLEPFIYDIVNRRDPFLPFAEFIAKPEGQAEDTGPQRALSPAQRWDLDQLKLIGIMWDIKDPKAMFLDPEQDVMILGRDESIGNRNGYVATIREGEVVVVEALRKRGDIIYRTKVLRIER